MDPEQRQALVKNINDNARLLGRDLQDDFNEKALRSERVPNPEEKTQILWGLAYSMMHQSAKATCTECVAAVLIGHHVRWHDESEEEQ